MGTPPTSDEATGERPASPGSDEARGERPSAPGSDEAAGERPSSPGRDEGWLARFGIHALALVLAGVFLLANVAKSGIWDPHELDRADLARRVAVHVYGAEALQVEAGANELPTLSDLGMGELPFTSMALGFKLLGLHDYAGRLPLALWALLGALVLYAFLLRLADRRTALYGVLVLVTMPLYFMQARTMLGDVVTMTAFTACFCGFAGALWDDGASGRWRRRAVTGSWLGVGLLGAIAGYLSRGVLIGVAAPCLAVGLGWLCLVGAGMRSELPGARLRIHGVGLLALALGTVAAVVGLIALLGPHEPREPLRRLLGVALLTKPPAESTFDLTIRDLGHSLFPWSAFLPFALGRLLWRRRTGSGVELGRDVALRVLLLVGVGCGYGVFALLAPHAGALPFAAPAVLAAVAAVVIRDFERGAPPSIPLAAGVAAVTVLLWHDLSTMPLRALSVFGVDERNFPKDFEAPAAKMMAWAAALFAAVVFLTWVERGLESDRQRVGEWVQARVAAYRGGLRDLAQLWKGNLLFGALVIEAALIGLGAMLLVGRYFGWHSVENLPHNFTLVGLNAWWLLPLGLLPLSLGFDLVRGLYGLALRLTRLPRAAATGLAALLSGGLLCFGYYPALAAQLSPKEVFERYAALHGPSEPLGVLGLRARAAEYYAGGEQVDGLASSRSAFRWLTAAPPGESPPRRWLVLRNKDLAELNSLFREHSEQNLPVIDAQSGSILLASNQLGGAPNENWLDAYLLNDVEHVQHPVSAIFEDQLEALGWDVVDQDGKLVDAVVPQRAYAMRFYYRVLKRITRNYKSFLHVDGYRRRHNGDHDLLDGRYRLSLWRSGDVVVDEYRLVLEPNFTPGNYTVYYGFFQGKKRFRIRQGKHHENRLNGGTLIVR